MADERSITILHVSDVQFGRHHQFPQEPNATPNEFDNLLTRIWDDIDLLHKEENLQPDLLICTGDLAEWAWQKEFADATFFLGAIAERLGLKRDRVAIIPGNHDVHRKECLRYFEQCIESGKKIVPPWYPKWFAYQGAFAEFYKEFPTIRFTPDEPWSLFVYEDLRVVVAGLNSTWVEGHDWPTDGSLPDFPDHERPHHFGYCHERQLRTFSALLQAERFHGWLKIGAVHHNLERGERADDENLRDAEDFERHLGRHLHLVLHGHTHRARFGQLRDAFPWFATGSAGLKQNIRPYGVPNQYQFLILSQAGVRIRARFYMPDEKDWADETRLKQHGRTGIKDVKVDWRDCKRFTAPASAKDEIPIREDPEWRGSGRNRAAAFREPETFLQRVAKCYELRYPGASLEQILRDEQGIQYLRVNCTESGIVCQFPVGVSANRPSTEDLDRFAELVLAHYRTIDPHVRAHFVYGGPSYTTLEVKTYAAGLGLDLRSFVETQGLIDFRDYLEKQNRRLLDDPVYPPNFYVPQRMDFEIGTERGFTDAALDQGAAWLSEPDPRFVLLLGEFGTGKTFLLHQIALRLGRQPGAPVPLLIELRAREKAGRLDQLLAQHFAEHDFARLDLRALRYMMREGRVILLFDGFDELALRVGYEKAADHLDTLIEAAEGDARVVVSSRTSHFEDDKQVRLALGRHVERLRGLRYCRLLPFDQRQIRAFLRNRFRNEVQVERWFGLLCDVKDLLGLGENPRMLSFICQLSPEQLERAEQRTGEISAAELYRILLVEYWFGYEMKRRYPKGVPRLLEPLQWLDTVTVLAVKLWTRTDRWLTLSDLREAVVPALDRHAPDKSSHTDEATHALGSGTLFIRDEQDRVTFVHQSVLEWLVSRSIAEDLQTKETSSLLDLGELSELMADFLLDLAEDVAQSWSAYVLAYNSGATATAKSNALTLAQRQLKRLEAALLNAAANERAELERRLEVWRYAAGFEKGIDLSGQDLRGKDLTGVNLHRAKLIGADLRETSLRNCDLAEAELTGADLRGALCDGAIFVFADMKKVNANGCSALEADFTAAVLDDSSWKRARLLRVTTLMPEQKQTMDLRGAAVEGETPVELRWPTPASISTAIAWSPDGLLLASGHGDGTVRLYKVESGEELLTLRGHESAVSSVAWSPDGKRLASGSSDKIVRLWEPESEGKPVALHAHEDSVLSVAWSPDGKRLASGSRDKTVRLWEPESGREAMILRGHADAVSSVAWSPDGKHLASGSRDKTVRLWEPESGREAMALRGHADAVFSVAWLPDGKRLASGSLDKTVRLWEPESGREAMALRGHEDYVLSVAWSPDGKRLASGSSDKTVRLWEPESGREYVTLRGHEVEVPE